MKIGRFAATMALLAASNLQAVAMSPTKDWEVLHTQTKWIEARSKGDAQGVDAVLDSKFKHISSNGKLTDRAQEISNSKPSSAVTLSEQTVDFAGDTAIVHGLMTVSSSGKQVSRERFTNVLVKVDGSWKVLAAHETRI